MSQFLNEMAEHTWSKSMWNVYLWRIKENPNNKNRQSYIWHIRRSDKISICGIGVYDGCEEHVGLNIPYGSICSNCKESLSIRLKGIDTQLRRV